MKREFSPASIALAAALLAYGAAPVFSQERPSSGQGSGEHAVPRGSGGGGSSASSPSGGGSSTSSSSSSSGGSSTGSTGGGGEHAVSRGGSREGGRGGTGGSRHAEPRSRSVVLPSSPGSTAYDPGDRSAPAPRTGSVEHSRPRGDRPATGRAVPRDISNVPIPPQWNDEYWNNWYYAYYTPYYQYGYAPCMPYYYGCFYYDPFWWNYYYGYGYGPGLYGLSAGGGYASSDSSDYDTGGLKLKVKPRDAQVYVDGYFSGVVDDYDGVFQKLKVGAGTHRVELRAEGYEPSSFDVLVVAGDTVTYRAELKKK